MLFLLGFWAEKTSSSESVSSSSFSSCRNGRKPSREERFGPPTRFLPSFMAGLKRYSVSFQREADDCRLRRTQQKPSPTQRRSAGTMKMASITMEYPLPSGDSGLDVRSFSVELLLCLLSIECFCSNNFARTGFSDPDEKLFLVKSTKFDI